MITYTNKELTAQVRGLEAINESLKWQLAKALAEVAKNRGQSNTSEAVEAIYQAYPRKIGKGAAIKAITKATANIHHDRLRRKVIEYAQAIAWQENRSLVPHPATWFNQERWLDDPKEWEQPASQQNTPPTTQFSL